ncbi:MAG: DMT family transporter [Chlamydiales bacterium]|nr:DMT family transporter [Chlamydiales bacterium]
MSGILQALFLYATWSSIFPIGKWLLSMSSPIFLTGARMFFAGILLTIFLIIRKKFSFRLNTKQWISIVLLGLFSIYLTNILEFWALQRLSAAKTCFIYSLSPMFTALLSYLHFKEKMTPMKWLGMSIGILGFIPVLKTQSASESLFHAFSFFSWPDIAMIGAAFFGVYGWILLRICVKDQELSPVVANGMSMLLGGALALATSFMIDSWHPLPVAEHKFLPFAGGVLIATMISNLLCYNLYGHLLKRFTATLLSFFGLLSPIFASITSWILIGESPSLAIIGSTFIVILGVWIIYREELKQGYITASSTS